MVGEWLQRHWTEGVQASHIATLWPGSPFMVFNDIMRKHLHAKSLCWRWLQLVGRCDRSQDAQGFALPQGSGQAVPFATA